MHIKINFVIIIGFYIFNVLKCLLYIAINLLQGKT